MIQNKERSHNNKNIIDREDFLVFIWLIKSKQFNEDKVLKT